MRDSSAWFVSPQTQGTSITRNRSLFRCQSYHLDFNFKRGVTAERDSGMVLLERRPYVLSVLTPLFLYSPAPCFA